MVKFRTGKNKTWLSAWFSSSISTHTLPYPTPIIRVDSLDQPAPPEVSWDTPCQANLRFFWYGGSRPGKNSPEKGCFCWPRWFFFVCRCVTEPMSTKYHGIKGKFKKNNRQTSKVCEWYGSRLWEEGAPTIPGEIPNWNDDDSPFSTQRCDTSRMPLPPRNMTLWRDH